MLGRSTPSPERAPDGPLNLNGNVESGDTSAATLLHEPTAGTVASDRNGKAPVETPTDGLEATLAVAPPSHDEGEQLAQESSASRNGAPELKEPDEESRLAGRAEQDRAASGTGLKESDEIVKPASGVRASLAAGGGVLVRWRGMRCTVFGVALVVLGGALGLSSALSVAMLVAGVLMLIVALIGPRLQGRFAIEFGPNGASIEIQTHMAPPGRIRVAGALAPWKPADDPSSTVVLPNKLIESAGETIEVDAEQLKTLPTDASQGKQPPG